MKNALFNLFHGVLMESGRLADAVSFMAAIFLINLGRKDEKEAFRAFEKICASRQKSIK